MYNHMKPIEEQTILITGSTDGIGELTAHKLAEQGARVLIHGRNQQKVDRVAEEIRNQTVSDKIETYLADFSALVNVREMTKKIRSDHNSLDVLINNAGIGFGEKREVSQDGYELRFAVNYLAPFLLTHLLLPSLKKAPSSRIVNVASVGQQAIDFDDVMLEKQYEAWRAYRQSKLALIMFTIELADRLPEGITVNSLHPGTFLRTKMVTEAGITPQGEPGDGAEAVTYLATAPKLQNVSGQYFNQKTEARANPQAYDADARRKLWKYSSQYTGLENHP